MLIGGWGWSVCGLRVLFTSDAASAPAAGCGRGREAARNRSGARAARGRVPRPSLPRRSRHSVSQCTRCYAAARPQLAHPCAIPTALSETQPNFSEKFYRPKLTPPASFTRTAQSSPRAFRESSSNSAPRVKFTI